VYLTKKKCFREWLGKKQHSPEQQAETSDYKRKHQKNNMSIWPASLRVKDASNLISWFSPTFSDALVNATVLTLLLKSFAGKKSFSHGVLANTARFLRFFSSETLPFIAPGGLGYFCDLKNLIWIFVQKINMTVCDQTKMTELKHTTTVQRNITSENRHKIW